MQRTHTGDVTGLEPATPLTGLSRLLARPSIEFAMPSRHSSAVPRVVVGSNFNDGMALYNGLCFEFAQVIRSVCDGTVVAPTTISQARWTSAIRAGYSHARRLGGGTRLPRLRTVKMEEDCDFFLYVCMSPNNLADLQAIRGWRERSRKAAVFLFETWSSQLERDRAHLAMLDQFDHVFVYNRSSIVNIRKYTTTPCTFLAAGADCLSATPFPDSPPRSIDVYSMGRRLESAHEQLHGMARRGEIHYVYDPGYGLRVYDFAESRLLTLNFIKRARYFTAYSLDAGPKAFESKGEQAIATRLFEGAAGGSIVLGCPPQAAEFKELFDWEDAVIEIPAEPEDMRKIYYEMEAQPERMNRARFMNATQSLRKHDWVYRLEQILNTLGFESSPGMRARKSALTALADDAEARFRPQG